MIDDTKSNCVVYRMVSVVGLIFLNGRVQNQNFPVEGFTGQPCKLSYRVFIGLKPGARLDYRI